MAWAILFASPHLHRASLVTGRCAACRNVPTPGRRLWTPGERKRARGHMVNPSKPRAVERAKAAARPEPQRCVGRVGSAVVGPATGPRPTGGEGDPTALEAPAGGTREAPWGVGHPDATGRQAGPYPGGRGGGRTRRPSGHRRERAISTEGDSQPARVLTSHGSSRESRRAGEGTHGPHGWATYGTERPWLSAPQLAPERLAQSGADRPQPALADLPSGRRDRRSLGLSGMRGNAHVPF
jgi:hypothetical protein